MTIPRLRAYQGPAILSYGFRPFFLLGNDAFFSTAMVALWRSWPFAFLMLMAGMQSIPHDVYDASAVDGAGPWKQWAQVTLPMLRPVNVVLVLMLFLWTFNDFNTPYVLFGAPAPDDVNVMPMLVYVTSFQSLRFGLSAAMAVVSLLLIAIPLFAYLRALRLDVHEGETR